MGDYGLATCKASNFVVVPIIIDLPSHNSCIAPFFVIQPPLQLDEGFCYIYIGLLLSALGENEGPAMGCRGPYIYGQGMLVYLNNEPDRWLLFFYRLKHVQGQDLLKIDAVTLRVRYRQSAFAQLPEK